MASSATGAAGALAGWAIASIGKQLSNQEVHSSLSSAPASAAQAGRTLSPAPAQTQTFSPSISATSTPTVEASPRLSSDSFSFGSTNKASKINVKKAAPAPRPSAGMKLGGAKKPKASLADTLASEWDDGPNGWDDDAAAADEVGNAWGNDDLIDVNADNDDWAAFESAPVPEIVVPPPQDYYVSSPAPAPAPKASTTKPMAKAAPVLAPAVKVPAPQASSTDGWGDMDEAPAEVASPKAAPQSTSGASSPARGSTPQPSLSGMSKEEKDKEMARRREERKAVSLGLSLAPRILADMTAYRRDEGAEKAESLG